MSKNATDYIIENQLFVTRTIENLVRQITELQMRVDALESADRFYSYPPYKPFRDGPAQGNNFNGVPLE